ncbi:hypothetical protein AB0D74_45650 [Streptomyces sp. NPDC048278]|uniref:hypothetical protein n=1 Tax=Streptomyces sp. NPDC048278 TaxID=3155809 RepID=UPI00342F28F6
MSAYDADRFLHDLAGDAELRTLARTAPRQALEAYDLTDRERELFLRGEVGLLYRGGVNDFLLHNVQRFGLFDVDADTYSARMRAEALTGLAPDAIVTRQAP